MQLPRRVGWPIFFSALITLAACREQPRVVISTRAGREIAFQVEVADTPMKREMGLQYRSKLANDQGMIFLFPSESAQTFWMKNTPISLDMIFINRGRKIVGIVEEAAPFSLDTRSVASPSQFVLEINGGLAKRLGIQTGDTVRFEGVQEGSAAR